MRGSVIRTLVGQLFIHGKVTTTLLKAKEVQKFTDRLVNIAKEGSTHSRKRISSCLPTGEAYSKLSVEIAQKYSCQNGGYTRVTRKGRRKGDSAQLASVEFSSSRNSAVLPN